MEMKRFDGMAKEEEQEAVALVLDVAKAFERVSLPVVLGLGNALQLPKEDIDGVVRILRAPRSECSSKGVWRSRSGPPRPSCQGRSGVACFCVLCCRMRWVKVQKFYPPLKLRLFVDDVTALLMGKNREVAEMAMKVMRGLEEEVEKKRPQVVSHGKWEGRKEKDDCVVWLLGGRAASMQQGRRSDVGRQRGNAWSGLEAKVGSKRRRKKCKVGLSILMKNKAYMTVGVKKLLQSGMVPART